VRRYVSVFKTRLRRSLAGSTGGSDTAVGSDGGEIGREVGEAGSGTADGGGIAGVVGSDESSSYRISTLLRVFSRSDKIFEEFDDPSLDCLSVLRSTRAYCTVSSVSASQTTLYRYSPPSHASLLHYSRPPLDPISQAI
jgi:hypothetical protein